MVLSEDRRRCRDIESYAISLGKILSLLIIFGNSSIPTVRAGYAVIRKPMLSTGALGTRAEFSTGSPGNRAVLSEDRRRCGDIESYAISLGKILSLLTIFGNSSIPTVRAGYAVVRKPMLSTGALGTRAGFTTGSPGNRAVLSEDRRRCGDIESYAIPLGNILSLLYLVIHQFPLCGQAMRSSGCPCFRQERWTPELRSPQVRLEIEWSCPMTAGAAAISRATLFLWATF